MRIQSKSFLITAFILSISPGAIKAQTPISEAARQADVLPAWPGCEPKLTDCTKSRLADFVAANLQIPMEAKAENAGGVVMMEFVIEKNGNIGEVRPMLDPGLGLGTEASRVISLMKSKKIKWTPAEDNGKRIAYRYIAPVSFNLMLPPKEKSEASSTKQEDASMVYDIVEVMPRYAGCEESMQDSIDCTFMKMINHIKSNLTYPEEALKKRIQGQVVIEFVIDAKGAVTSPVVKEKIGYGCDEEAVRLLTSMPAWTPGMQDGVAVPVKMLLPIFFQLSKEKE